MRDDAWDACLLFESIEDFDSFGLWQLQRTFGRYLNVRLVYACFMSSFLADYILIVFESTFNIL